MTLQIRIFKFETIFTENGSERKIPKYQKGIHFECFQDLFSETKVNQAFGSIPLEERINYYYATTWIPQDNKYNDRLGKEQNIVFFDIDGVPEDRRKEAAQVATKALGWKYMQTNVVWSGNGLQIVATFPRGKAWEPSWKHFKELKGHYRHACEKIEQAFIDAGFKVGPKDIHLDTSVFDPKRIMRIPYTINQKEGVNKKAFVIKQAEGHHPDWEFEKPPEKEKTFENTYATIDGDFIRKECEFVKWADQKPDEVHEPHWYALLQILGFDPKQHDYLRKQMSKYTSSKSIMESDFDVKLQQALKGSGAGPRSCENVNHHWKHCHRCPHNQNIKYPIELKSENFIGTKHLGFTTKQATATSFKLIRHHSDLMKYLDQEWHFKHFPSLKRFMRFNGKFYEISYKCEILGFAMDHFKPEPQSREFEEFGRRVINSTAFQTDPSFLYNPNNFKDIINFSNGVYNFVTNELRPHDPELGFTYCLPYDIAQTQEATPVYDQFMDDITCGREDYRKILEEYMGYILSNDPYKFQTLLALEGEGNNGKTTFLNLIRKMLGPSAISYTSLAKAARNRFLLSQFAGKLCNIAEEEPEHVFKKLSDIKLLTGGGSLNAERKGEHPFDFENRAKIIVTWNDRPELGDSTKGTTRRILVIPFNFDADAIPGKRNPNILEEMSHEIPQIYRKILQEYLKIRNSGGFTQPIESQQIREQMVLDSNPVQDFLKHCVEISSAEALLTYDELYQCFRENYREDVLEHSPATWKKRFLKALRAKEYFNAGVYIIPKNGPKRPTKIYGIALKK